MKFTLPLPPNRANRRRHWRTEKKEHDDYFLACLVRYGKKPKRTFEKARIKVKAYTHQTMDTDNLMARLKHAVDFLVTRGYIVDDKPKHLEWDMPTQAVDRKNQRIEVWLDETAIEEPEGT